MTQRTVDLTSTGTTLPAVRPTAPLPAMAVYAMHRLELALADRTVANFDNHGSLWGYNTVAKTEANIAEARANGQDISEWETVDRDGRPLRIVRIADDSPLADICVFSTRTVAA